MAKTNAGVCVACGGPLNAPVQGGRIKCGFCGAINVVEAHEKKGDELICPECGAANPKEAKHCGRCGIQLEFNCPKCGTVNAYGTAFCVKCGVNVKAESTRLEEEAKKAQEEQQRLQEELLKRTAEEKRKQRISTLVVTGVVLAALLCLVIVGGVWYYQSYMTPSAQGTRTAVSLEKTATASYNLLFGDDFSDLDSGWGEYTSAEGTANYHDNGFRINVLAAEYLIYYTPGEVYPNNIRIEVDARKIGGVENNGFGVICRFQDPDNFYWLGISNDGYAVIKKVVNNNTTVLSSTDGNWNKVDGIFSGWQTNHIRADCVGDSLVLYANGIEVARTIDSQFREGQVGLLVAAYEADGADILFDNFFVFLE